MGAGAEGKVGSGSRVAAEGARRQVRARGWSKFRVPSSESRVEEVLVVISRRLRDGIGCAVASPFTNQILADGCRTEGQDERDDLHAVPDRGY